MAKRIGYNTSIVSVRQEDKDKMNEWLNKLGAHTPTPIVPYSAPKPTSTPKRPIKPTKATKKKTAPKKTGSTMSPFSILAGWASNPALSGQPASPQTPEERRKYLNSLTRK